MPARTFYNRERIRLNDFRAVRFELTTVYRACVAKILSWEDGRSAALILARIGAMDESVTFEHRIAAIEQALPSRMMPPPRRPNGPGSELRQ